jgi:flagellar hook assembly protein FlgD
VKGSFPNPAEFGVNIIYELCRESSVSARIYDVSGETVYTGKQNGKTGKNAFYWDFKNTLKKNSASGVYIYSVEAVSGEDRQKKWGKMAVVK